MSTVVHGHLRLVMTHILVPYVIFVRSFQRGQGRINHEADKAKSLGPTKKKGPTKIKNEGKGAYKCHNEGNRPSKNCPGSTRALIRP